MPGKETQCEVSFATTVGLVIMRLSEILDPENQSRLPLLCQHVRSCAKGRAICAKAHRCAANLSEACKETPLLLCCRWAGKLLLLRAADGQIYVAFCRSPVPDYRHLEDLTKLLQHSGNPVIKVSNVKSELWERLPKFGEGFVHDVVSKIQGEMGVSIPDTVIADLERLGSKYTQFTLDVAGYSGLRAMPPAEDGCEGALSIQVSSHSKGGSVFRFVVRRIASNTSGSSSMDSAVPVVGLAGYTNRRGPDRDLLQKFNSVLLGSASKYKPVVLKEHGSNGNGDGGWDATLSFHLNRRPSQKWLDDARKPVRVALHVGGETVGSYLVDGCKSSDLTKFLERTSHFSDSNILPKTENARPPLLSRVLRDLANTLKGMEPENARFVLSSRREAIRGIVRFVESQPQVQFPIPDPQIGNERRRQRFLLNHLSNGRPAYTDMLQAHILMDRMIRTSKYSEEELAQFGLSPGAADSEPAAYVAKYGGHVTRIENGHVFIVFHVEGEIEERQFTRNQLKVDDELLRKDSLVVATTRLVFLPSPIEPTPEEQEATLRQLKEFQAEVQGIDGDHIPFVPPLEL